MKKTQKNFSEPYIFAFLVIYHLRGKNPPERTLTIEYTFIRYIPERGRKSQPNEGAPRPSCPSGL